MLIVPNCLGKDVSTFGVDALAFEFEDGASSDSDDNIEFLHSTNLRTKAKILKHTKRVLVHLTSCWFYGAVHFDAYFSSLFNINCHC